MSLDTTISSLDTTIMQDTTILSNVAVMYYQPGQQLVQTRQMIQVGVEWLENALKYDVMDRLTRQANFFLGLGVLFQIFDFDQQIVAKAENLTAESGVDLEACDLVSQEAEMVQRGSEAMTIGSELSPAMAQQLLQQYGSYQQRLPQLREAFKCPS